MPNIPYKYNYCELCGCLLHEWQCINPSCPPTDEDEDEEEESN